MLSSRSFIVKYVICTWDGCETSALVMLAILCNGEPELLSSIFGDCKYCDDDDDDDIIHMYHYLILVQLFVLIFRETHFRSSTYIEFARYYTQT